MNLVDAIRKAGTAPADLTVPTAQRTTVPTPTTTHPVEIQPEAQENLTAPEETAIWPGTPATGNLVRIELLLSPEQTQALLRNALTQQKTVWTSRDVAVYLRMHASTVEKMANEGALPAFKVEGHWRFTKTAIDDWMAAQAATQQGIGDVA